MAQIAIPLVVVGVLYLISNDKKNENFTNHMDLAEVSTDPNAGKLNNDIKSDEKSTFYKIYILSTFLL